MASEKNQSSLQPEMYEGSEPYVFLSYSHKDQYAMNKVREFLTRNHIRFWYDNGLHSGDDWNLVIAKHLDKAAVCLLLLSENSAASDYVKNELNFALNHRIPIHSLMIEAFTIPIDIEIMIGRIQHIVMQKGYEQELFAALPPGVIDRPENAELAKEADYQHPLFETGEELLNRQGTVFYAGAHKVLKYPVLVSRDVIREAEAEKLMRSAVAACSLSHPLFISLLDVKILQGYMWTYMGFHKLQTLDRYLAETKPDEETIRRWTGTVIDGMDYLLKKNYAVHDFARGSLMVTDDKDIRIMRLHNGYYGIFRLQADNRRYYMENEMQEIAALLYQLCTGEIPVLPFPIIQKSHVGSAFLKQANLIIQKAAKVQGSAGYASFGQMRDDLSSARISLKDSLFLRQRAKTLEQYLKAKNETLERFTSEEEPGALRPPAPEAPSLEEQFGFESTVALEPPAYDMTRPGPAEPEKIRIRLQVGTGTVLTFSKDRILIGRGPECDARFTQNALSRMHARLDRLQDGTYLLTDLQSTNGTSYGKDNIRLDMGQSVPLSAGDIFQAGGVVMKILP